MNTTAEDLRDMCDSPSHHGHGFSVAYRELTGAQLAVAEKLVLARAGHLGLDRGQLFLWLDSAYGRWFCDSLTGGKPSAIQELMTVELVDGLVAEATDDLLDGINGWLETNA